MVDVARLAGVSAMTVSRALRQPDRVSPETRRRVAQAIGRVGYVPDLVAAGLASQRTRLVAIIIPTLADSIFADTVKGASDVLRSHGYQVVIGDAAYSEEEEERLTVALLGRRPDGMILTGVDHRPRARKLIAESGIPVVETWALTPRPLDSVVGFSNQAAGRAMTRHLLDGGFKRIGFVGGDDRRAMQRRSGYEAALRERDAGPARAHTFQLRIGLRAGGDGIERLLAEHPDVDAVFFSSDILAAGGLFACQRRGLSVPDGVAIAGLGDFDIGAEVTPAITTVRIPRRDMGVRAAELMLDRLEGRAARGVNVDVGFEIVPRASTAR
jgi:LacI family gluconate utilization system Gnt-I transcriptional repressor